MVNHLRARFPNKHTVPIINSDFVSIANKFYLVYLSTRTVLESKADERTIYEIMRVCTSKLKFQQGTQHL